MPPHSFDRYHFKGALVLLSLAFPALSAARGTGVCDDPSFGSEFKFSAHKDEIIVGSIFVRIYNEQPMFQLEVSNSINLRL